MTQRRDWSYASPEVREIEELEGGWEYEKYDKDVGLQARELLGHLSADLRYLPVDELGWAEPEVDALFGLELFDRMADLLVPPDSTPQHNRREYRDLLRSFRQALPFSDAERQFLCEGRMDEGIWFVGRQRGREIFSTQQVELVSDGIRRVVYGRDLLQRWWFWRRELGAYSDGGLNQARESLAGITTLLTPELGLPGSYRTPST